MTGIEVRPDLAGLEPYVSPQRPGFTGARLNTNESPYPPPTAVVEELLAGMGEAAFNRYPDRDARSLLAALSTHVSWPAEGLWLANGSNEIFMHLFLAFGGAERCAVVFEPTYSLHTLIPRVAATEVKALPRDESFNVDLGVALEAIDREQPAAVILCSPNNPTGNLEARMTVEAILDRAPGLVIVDEAYGEFAAKGSSVRDLLPTHPNLVLVKTFSKAWSLAGARLGYLLADPELVRSLSRVRLPYHLSTPTQLLGEAVLRYSDQMTASVEKVVTERDRLGIGLQRLGIRTFPSSANFVLFEIDGAAEVWTKLLNRGVLVRRYPSTPRLERCLRVTAGLPEETDLFLGALEEVLGED